jgi:hypothetical protein
MLKRRLATAVAGGRAEAAAGFGGAFRGRELILDPWVVPECVDADVAAAVARRGLCQIVLARPRDREAPRRALDLWFERWRGTWFEVVGRSALGGRRAPDQCRLYHRRVIGQQHLGRYSHEYGGGIQSRMPRPITSRPALAYWAVHENEPRSHAQTLRAARAMVARAPMRNDRIPLGAGAPPFNRRWMIYSVYLASPDERRWLARQPDPPEW